MMNEMLSREYALIITNYQVEKHIMNRLLCNFPVVS